MPVHPYSEPYTGPRSRPRAWMAAVSVQAGMAVGLTAVRAALLAFRLMGPLAALMAILLFGTTAVQAKAVAGQDSSDRPAVVLAAFGTSRPEARVAYAAVEARVRSEFPGHEVRWAYTSHTIRRAGDGLDSPALALARLLDKGVKRVAVLSLHVIPGREFDDLTGIARAFATMPDGFEAVEVCGPLMADAESIARLAGALLASAPTRKPNQALLLVGHGTRHAASACYPALQRELSRTDRSAFVGALTGEPFQAQVIAALRAGGQSSALVLPLMTVAGAHTAEDLAGPGPDSWRSALEVAGISAEVGMTGLAERPAVVDIWMDQLKAGLARLEHFADDPRDGAALSRPPSRQDNLARAVAPTSPVHAPNAWEALPVRAKAVR